MCAYILYVFFFFKQKTAYELRISDWSSDVCSSDLIAAFKSVPFWAIDVSLSAGGQAFSAQWVPPDGCTDDAGRCLQQPIAQQAAQQIRAAGSAQEIGRASCRERVCQYV